MLWTAAVSKSRPTPYCLLGEPLPFCARRAIELLEGVAYEMLSEGHLTRNRSTIGLGKSLLARVEAMRADAGDSTCGQCIRLVPPD